MELLSVIIIISILVAMLFPAMQQYRTRTEKVNCITNLKNLYSGANSYVQDVGHWPQIDIQLEKNNPTQYAAAWISALQPYGISQQIWVCPTVQRLAGNPDLTDPKNVRIDYFSTPFDNLQYTPYRWPHQPWFLERGAVHDGGNLIIFTNGSVQTLTDVFISLHH